MVNSEVAKEIKINRLDELYKRLPLDQKESTCLWLNIAGLKIHFFIYDNYREKAADFLKKYLKPFISQESTFPDLSLHFVFSQGQESSIQHSLWNQTIPRTYIQNKSDDTFYLIQRDFAAIHNRETHEIWGWGPQFGTMNSVTIDNFLSLCLAQAFLEKEALLLHASAAVHQGKALLFMGPSGVGKSTLCNQLADNGLPIISGDRLYIRREENTLWAYPSTVHIHGFETGDSRRTYTKYPIEEIFLLKQLNQFHYKALSPENICKDFLEQTLCFQPEFIDYSLHFQLAAHILNLSSLKFAEVSYPKNKNMLDFLKKN